MVKSNSHDGAEVVKKRGNFLANIFRVPEVSVFFVLIVISLVFYGLSPVFLSPDSITTMLRAMSFTGVVLVGQTILLITGAFDLSVGSTAGLAAIVCSYVMVHLEQLPDSVAVLLGILAGLIVGLVVGLFNSFVVIRLEVPAFIATLGMLNIAKGITFLISKGYTIYPLPEAIKTFGTAEPLNISWSFFIFLIMVFVAHFTLSRTVFGRELYVIGGNKDVAYLAGIDPRKIQMSGFVIAGICASIGGMLMMSRIAIGNPTIGLGWELNVIAGAVIGGVSLFGGRGSIIGAVLGLAIMQVVTSGLVVTGLDPYWQTVAVGLLMIVAVAVDVLRGKSKMLSS